MKLTKKMIKKLKDDPTISRLRSYSPTINEEIERLSISPHKELFYQEQIFHFLYILGKITLYADLWIIFQFHY